MTATRRSTSSIQALFATPKVKRTAFAEEPNTTMLAVGSVPGKAYEAGGWETWAPGVPLYQAGEYEQLADRLSAVLADDPPFSMVKYNAACVMSLAGRSDDALKHLRRAVELSGLPGRREESVPGTC